MAANGNGTPTGGEQIVTDIITLSRFITEEQTKHKEATGDFTYAVARSNLSDLLTSALDFYARLYSSPSSR